MRTDIKLGEFTLTAKQQGLLDVAAVHAGINTIDSPGWIQLLERIADGECQVVRPEWNKYSHEWVVKERKMLSITPNPFSPRLNRTVSQNRYDGSIVVDYEWKTVAS